MALHAGTIFFPIASMPLWKPSNQAIEMGEIAEIGILPCMQVGAPSYPTAIVMYFPSASVIDKVAVLIPSADKF